MSPRSAALSRSLPAPLGSGRQALAPPQLPGLLADGGKDAFVHFSGIAGDGFRTLAEGVKVEYELGESAKGPQATNVRVI